MLSHGSEARLLYMCVCSLVVGDAVSGDACNTGGAARTTLARNKNFGLSSVIPRVALEVPKGREGLPSWLPTSSQAVVVVPHADMHF